MDPAATQHFRLIFRQVPGAVWVTDRDLRLTHVQGRLPHAAGVDAERLIGSTVYDFIGTHDRTEPAIAHHLEALSGDRTSFQQVYNGRTYEVLIEPLRDPHGGIAGCVGSAIDITDRQAAFEQLARSQLRLAEAQRVAHVGSFEWDVAPNRLTWSDELHRIYGIEPGQFEGTYEAFLRRVHPDDAAITERAVLDAFQKRGPFTYDHRIVRADGVIRVLHTRGDIICDDVGRAVRIVGSCWDVTEWKHVNETLQRSVSLLQAIFEATADGLLVVDRDGLITAFNQRFVRLWNIPQDLAREGTDERIRAFILDRLEDPHGSHQAMRRLSGHAASESFDVLRTRDGRVFERYSTPQRLGTEIVGRVWSFRDVTAYTKMEDRLRAGAAQLELAVNAAHVGLWDWDLRSNHVFYSSAWKRQLGYEEDEIANNPSEWHERVHPDDRDRLRNTLDAFVENPWPGFNMEYRMRHRDGSYRWILAQASLVRDESELPTHVLGSHVDVTDRKREEEALRLTNIELEQRVAERTRELEAAMRQAQGADRLKSSFLATMSHELRTPLNSIIGFTGVLLKGLAGPLNEEQQKQLGMARDSANHLLALINDVLDISRIEAGQLEIVKSPFDIRAAVESVLRAIAPLATKKGLALVTAIDSKVGTVVSDRRRVEQILLNLLNNGVKFTEHGEVRLECRTQGRFLETTVSDTGIGIRPEHMDRLFKPFQQVDTGLDRRHEGTGLGLSICANLVRLLGGDIRARSEYGVGSAFTFTVPLTG